MKTSKKNVRVLWVAAVAALLLSTGCTGKGSKDSAAASSGAMMSTGATMPAASLTGAEQVPPAATSATGSSTIMVGADKMVTGSVQVMGMTATAAHIHEGAKGMNGPVIVPFTKTGDNTFAPAPDAKMTDAQYASYMAGNTYVNVHSAMFPGGEIRVQLWPAK